MNEKYIYSMFLLYNDLLYVKNMSVHDPFKMLI